MIDQKLIQLSLQCFMAHGCLADKDAKDLIQKCCNSCQESFSDELFRSIIKTINLRIKKYSFEIRNGTSEDDDGQVYYCYVNTKEDKHARLASFYSINELVFFKAIVERLIISPEGFVNENIALQARERISVCAAKEFLDRLINDKWLSRTEVGHYYLGPRSLLDLLPFLRSNIDSSCSICASLVIRGRLCPKCDNKVHFHCLSRFANGRSSISCPHCGEDWDVTVT